MNDSLPSLQQMNRTLIGSVLFIDIVDYSQRTVPDQIAMKELFISLLTDAVRNVAPSDRIMVDTGDGAGIAFLGDPEDALFAALSLRDAIDAGKATVGAPGFVRMGINLGPLKVVRDINGHTNMIGDGVNDAQRVMSFSEPGQVMVSHAYYDIISRFSHDYSKLFVYEGTRHDKHVREHEVYRFGPVEATENLAEKLRDRSRARQSVSMASPSVATAKRETAPQPVHKPAVSRVGLLASLIGAITIVGTVWSWTSGPDIKPGNVPATASMAVSASSSSVAESTASNAAKIVTDKKPETAATAFEPAPPASAATSSATDKETPETKKFAKLADNTSPPVKPGMVKLAIQPWGEIYVDGGKRGISPPLRSFKLPPGKHRIEIRNGQFAPYKETIEVKSGVESTVHYAF
jgi:class 3 adenylate cyclase